MIAGYRPIATKAADDRADARPEGKEREDAAENAKRPLHGGRRHHRAEADHRTDGQIDSAGEHDDGFRRRNHRRREPALDEFGHRSHGENAGKQNRIDRREHSKDQEQRAEAFIAAPLDRPIESRSLTQH